MTQEQIVEVIGIITGLLEDLERGSKKTYTQRKNIDVKAYKVGSNVTRIDIVEKQ
jgi:hypothetical protein